MNVGVYRIRNRKDGTVYIGASTRLSRRFADHRYRLRQGTNECRNLQAAFDRYGPSAFVFEVVVICSPPELPYYERAILLRQTQVYNHNASDITSAGLKLGPMTPPHRAKISQALKGRPKAPFSAETRARMSLAQKGRPKGPMAEASKQKLSAAHRGRIFSEEHKAALSASKTGKRWTQARREAFERARARKELAKELAS